MNILQTVSVVPLNCTFHGCVVYLNGRISCESSEQRALIDQANAHTFCRAGGLFRDNCGISSSTTAESARVFDGTCFITETITYTLPRFALDYRNMPVDQQDGIGTNWCQLETTFLKDAGYALMTQDQWYNAYNVNNKKASYRLNSIPGSLTNGLTPPREIDNLAKRWLQDHPLDMSDLVIDDGNTTTLKSEEELWEHYGVKPCRSYNCEAEKLELGAIDLEDLEKDLEMTYLPPPSPTAAESVASNTGVAIPATPAGGSRRQSPVETRSA